MQRTKLINRIIGIVGLIISVILIINFSDLYLFLIDFCEKYLSRDNHIGPKMVFIIKIFITTGILLIATISLIFIQNLTSKVYKFILEYFQLNNSFAVKICRVKRIDLSILVIGTVLGLFQIYHLLTFGEPIGEFGKPSSEGMMEKIFSLLLLFSILILIISITKVKRDVYPSIIRRKIILSIVVIFGILLLILGEEISWGQRIFGWDSFGIFNEYNYQNETNAHNFFNPYVKYIYPIVGIGSFIVLFSIWLFPKNRKNYFFNLLFPHPSLFFLALIMAISSFFGGGGETFEQLFTIFVLLYSFRLFMCLSFPDIDLLSQNV